GQLGQAKQKERLADDLLEIAATAQPVEVKKFLLEEAQYLVSQKHLKLLAAHLQNPELAEYAIKAMMRVPAPELEIILLKNLDHLPSDSKKPVIQALGLLRSKQAVSKLRLLAESNIQEIKNLALAALTEIADPTTEPMFASVATLASKSEKSQAVELYLRFAHRLAEEGHKEQALKIARKSIQNLTAPEEIGHRCEALTLLINILGEKAEEEILVALQDENQQFRKHTLDLASQHNWPELTSLLLKKLPELRPQAQAEVIEFFGNMNDSSLAQVVASYLESPEENVRLAALKGFTRLNKKEALPYLLAGIKGSESELAPCLDLLRTYPSEAYLSELRKIFPELSENSKARLLQNLQDIVSPQWKELVWQAARSENSELKKAAADCLAQVVNQNDLDQLLARLSELDDPALLSGYQQAVVAAMNQVQDIEVRQKTYLDYLDKAKGNARVNLIKLLPQVGGSACLKKSVEFLNDKDPAIIGAAVAAVTSWNEFEAAGALVNLIKTNPDRKVRYLAFQGLARLMKAPGVSNE
ncbi:MAG: HEAT repeat domain-containing protein, partial [Candidatus Saccharicenans sp.]